jgi:nicotinamidase-related amidase
MATVLLVCDIQNGIIDRLHDHDVDAYLSRLSDTISAARKANIRIMYVRVAFRPTHPEISSANSSFAKVKAFGGFLDTDASTQIHSKVAPRPEDAIVTKRRVSAFHATDLDLMLRSQGVNTIAIAGLSTSGVVMSTVRQGSDLDYSFVMLEDLCLDTEQTMHDACLKILGKQAEIMKAKEWVGKL